MNEPANNHKPPRTPRRRFAQFSLRTLLVLLTVAAIWFGLTMHRAHQQRRAVAEIKRLGGAVMYDYEIAAREASSYTMEEFHDVEPQPAGPPWLRELLGGDYFDSVHYVSIVNNKEVDDLDAVAQLPELQTLYLMQLPVVELASLSELTQLRSLSLQQMPVRDIRPLRRLTSMKKLSLYGTSVEDVAPLAGLTRLWSLSLHATRVHDLSPLAGLTRLQVLDLSGTPVRDLSPLRSLQKLESLSLNDTQVNDLSPLADLSRLRILSFQRTEVADVSPLLRLKQLKEITFSDTHVSVGQVQELQAALPRCQVRRVAADTVQEAP